MSPQLVEKVVSEISNNPTLRKVGSFQCGENGEAFLNPHALECMRIIRETLPKCIISVFTNFSLLTREKSAAIIGERLVDHLSCNIDGHDDHYYKAVKGLDLKTTEENIINFLAMRNETKANISLTIQSLTYSTYVKAIRSNLGVAPLKLTNNLDTRARDDFRLIKQRWKPLLNPNIDRIVRVFGVTGWAERPWFLNSELDYSRYRCPYLEKIRHEAFIAPDGTWYACCNDANNELVIGNLKDDSFVGLAMSERRSKLILALENRRFKEIGGPCKTVVCCQLLYGSKVVKAISLLVKPQSRLAESGRRLTRI